MVENLRVTPGNQNLSEIVFRVVSLNRCIIFSLHLLEDWGLKLDETAVVKGMVRVREKTEGPVCKKDGYDVMREVIQKKLRVMLPDS